MVKIYKQPFAHDGDTIAIPDASQPDGKMSSADGWTLDYQLPKTDPNYKPVGRQEMNGVFKEVTEALGQVQVQGTASWSAYGAPYPINAQVYHNGKQWLALRANSVAPVEGEDWSAIGTAATRDVGTEVGNVMQVGAFGLGGASWYTSSYPVSTTQTGFSKFANTGDPALPDNGMSVVFGSRITTNTAASDNWLGQLYSNVATGPEYLLRFRTSINGAEWSQPVTLLHTGNILQTTGNSTDLPMSQKAVTDALGVFGQPSMTGSATLNGTTNNTVQLTDIVTILGLEVGDVIRIQYSGYDKLHTVESITDANSIIVNYEHAGNRANGSLKLADQTATVTITRIAKWYNAPLGLGQAWVNVTAARMLNTQYLSPPNRSFGVYTTTDAGTYNNSYTLTVDGVVAVTIVDDYLTGLQFAVINVSNNYKYESSMAAGLTWRELR